MTTILVSLAVSLVLTILLETVFFFLVRAKRIRVKRRYKKDLVLLVLVNLITNPTVVLIYWLASMYTNWYLTLILIPLEVFAVLTEGCLYKKFGQDFKRPYGFAIAANIFSFLLGVVIQLFI